MHKKIVAIKYPIQLLLTEQEKRIDSENLQLLGEIGKLTELRSRFSISNETAQKKLSFMFSQKQVNLEGLFKDIEHVLKASVSGYLEKIEQDLGAPLFDSVFSQIRSLKEKISSFLDVNFYKEIVNDDNGKKAHGIFAAQTLDIKVSRHFNAIETLLQSFNRSTDNILSDFYRTFSHEVWHFFHIMGEQKLPVVPKEISDFYLFVSTTLAEQVALIESNYMLATQMLAKKVAFFDDVKPIGMDMIRKMNDKIDDLISNPLNISYKTDPSTYIFGNLLSDSEALLINQFLSTNISNITESDSNWSTTTVKYNIEDNTITIFSSNFNEGKCSIPLNAFWDKDSLRTHVELTSTLTRTSKRDECLSELEQFISVLQKIQRNSVQLKSLLERSLLLGINITSDKKYFFDDQEMASKVSESISEVTRKHPEWYTESSKNLMDYVMDKSKGATIADFKKAFRLASSMKEKYLSTLKTKKTQIQLGEVHSNFLLRNNKKNALDILIEDYGFDKNQLDSIELIKDLDLLGVPNWKLASIIEHETKSLSDLEAIRDAQLEELGYKNKTVALALLRRNHHLKQRLAQLKTQAFLLENVVITNNYVLQKDGSTVTSPFYYEGYYYSNLSKSPKFTQFGNGLKETKQILDTANNALMLKGSASGVSGLLK